MTSKRTTLEWKKLFESEQFEKDYFYNGNDLGYILTEEDTEFKVWAPTAEKVILNVYESGDEECGSCVMQLPMKKYEKGVWRVSAGKSLENMYYTFTVEVNGDVNETQDVYSVACGANGKRSMIVDLEKTNPDNWKDDIYIYEKSRQPVIYELHIKDFSFKESSGIPEEYRGKYKAFTIDDSTLNNKGKKPTCISYLKTLGITHIHLLPSFDFGSVDETKNFDKQFNWGYDPENYNVPEGSYSTDAHDGRVRIREFKEMVQAIHNAGFGVIMDVVYNHTYSLDSCFQKTVPYYYYRINENGSMSNGSVCGNDTASERAMYRKFMVDSVVYWAKEYHIDGFRFDLMGLHDVKTMNSIREAIDKLPNGEHILMYGEPWAGGSTAMKAEEIPALKKNIEFLNERIAIFNDDTRDVIKGSVFYKEKPGFVNGKSGLEEEIASSVLSWYQRSDAYKPKGPGQIISYVSAHDNWTLWDKLNYTLREKPDFLEKNDEILQMNKFAAGIYLTCLGTIFLQAGEEAGRTKLGIGDSYNSPPDINALDWERMYDFEDLIEYYRGLLNIRRIAGRYLRKDADAVKGLKIHKSMDGCVIFSVEANDKTEPWKRLWIVYLTMEGAEHLAELNGQKVLELPEGRRLLLCDGNKVLKTPMVIELKNYVPVCAGGVSIFSEI